MLRQIMYFQAAADCGDLKRAAEYCFVSTAALEKQIRMLELEIGAELLERRSRSVTLTSAGKHFYDKSLEMIPEFGQLLAETVYTAHREKGQIYLGCVNGCARKEFRQAAEKFTQRHPELSVHIDFGSHGELYQKLIAGRIDLVASDPRPAFRDNFESQPLASMQCFIELAASNPLARQVGVEIAQLRDAPGILVSAKSQHKDILCLYRDVLGIGSELMFAESSEEARRHIISGEGYMLLEGDRREQPAPGLRRVLLLRNGEPFSLNYRLFWREDGPSQYLPEFADQLRSQFLPGYRR